MGTPLKYIYYRTYCLKVCNSSFLYVQLNNLLFSKFDSGIMCSLAFEIAYEKLFLVLYVVHCAFKFH